jgi:endonuclease/exonuclease/phosphatase family metal-dependent hydrolase
VDRKLGYVRPSRVVTAFLLALTPGLSAGPAAGQPPGGGSDYGSTALSRHRAANSLTVMSYNVEGLPAPARFGRAASLDRIAAHLADLRQQGREPDVVMLQEAFAGPGARIAQEAGYRYVVAGPSAHAVNAAPAPAAANRFVAVTSHLKGEGDGKWLDSGLRILSDYPITKVDRLAFPTWACAGYDCLANKGALIAWVRIPGSAQPVAFIDTHLNSRAASGVPQDRADTAYAYQTVALRQFIAERVPAHAVAFLGGDFNTGRAKVRWHDLGGSPLTQSRNTLLDAFASEHTLAQDDRRDMEAILRRAKDWLFYRGNMRLSVTLTGFEVPFGVRPDGSSLSDHLGYEAHYRVWGV